MKLNAVSNRQIRQNNLNNNRKNNQNLTTNKNVNFTGGIDGLIAFWNFIDGSRAWQFTVEDMCETNFPRTWKGAMSGYKYTGKVNVPALLQEAIREFMTGPIMSVTPFGILAVATLFGGKSVNTHRKNIENLSHIASTMPKEVDAKDFKDSYLKTAIEDMLKQSLAKEKVDSEDIETIFNGVKKYDEIVTLKEKGHKKKAKAALAELSETFKDIIKSKRDNFKGVDFSTAVYSTSENAKIGATGFENYVKYMTSYAHDYAKVNEKNGIVDLAKDAIETFKTNRIGRRVLTVASMIGLTGIIMSIIPKLYTLASGDTNPDTLAYANEAQKREGK